MQIQAHRASLQDIQEDDAVGLAKARVLEQSLRAVSGLLGGVPEAEHYPDLLNADPKTRAALDALGLQGVRIRIGSPGHVVFGQRIRLLAKPSTQQMGEAQQNKPQAQAATCHRDLDKDWMIEAARTSRRLIDRAPEGVQNPGAEILFRHEIKGTIPVTTMEVGPYCGSSDRETTCPAETAEGRYFADPQFLDRIEFPNDLLVEPPEERRPELWRLFSDRLPETGEGIATGGQPQGGQKTSRWRNEIYAFLRSIREERQGRSYGEKAMEYRETTQEYRRAFLSLRAGDEIQTYCVVSVPGIIGKGSHIYNGSEYCCCAKMGPASQDGHCTVTCTVVPVDYRNKWFLDGARIHQGLAIDDMQEKVLMHGRCAGPCCRPGGAHSAAYMENVPAAPALLPVSLSPGVGRPEIEIEWSPDLKVRGDEDLKFRMDLQTAIRNVEEGTGNSSWIRGRLDRMREDMWSAAPCLQLHPAITPIMQPLSDRRDPAEFLPPHAIEIMVRAGLGYFRKDLIDVEEKAWPLDVQSHDRGLFFLATAGMTGWPGFDADSKEVTIHVPVAKPSGLQDRDKHPKKVMHKACKTPEELLAYLMSAFNRKTNSSALGQTIGPDEPTLRDISRVLDWDRPIPPGLANQMIRLCRTKLDQTPPPAVAPPQPRPETWAEATQQRIKQVIKDGTERFPAVVEYRLYRSLLHHCRGIEPQVLNAVERFSRWMGEDPMGRVARWLPETVLSPSSGYLRFDSETGWGDKMPAPWVLDHNRTLPGCGLRVRPGQGPQERDEFISYTGPHPWLHREQEDSVVPPMTWGTSFVAAQQEGLFQEILQTNGGLETVLAYCRRLLDCGTAGTTLAALPAVRALQGLGLPKDNQDIACVLRVQQENLYRIQAVVDEVAERMGVAEMKRPRFDAMLRWTTDPSGLEAALKPQGQSHGRRSQQGIAAI